MSDPSPAPAPNPYGFPPVTRLDAEPAQIDARAVRWFPHAPGPSDRVVLLLHGLGSHEEDLIGLAPALPRGLVYGALRGVFACGGGYAWLNPPPLVPADSAMLEESASALEAWIAGLEGRPAGGAPARPGPRVVGAIGFSQGAMLSLQLLRQDASALEWVVQLSGAPFPTPMPGDAALAAAQVPALWGHGGVDPLFDPEREDQVRQWMRAHTTLTEELSPYLGHGIDEQVLAAVVRFVEARLREGGPAQQNALEDGERPTGL